MNKPNEPNFDTEVELVNVPPDTDGDPLALFESESETGQSDLEASETADDSVFVSRNRALPAPARARGPLPLDRLLQRLGHVDWTESVAIVDALCGELTSRQSDRVPEMSRVAITFEGTVLVGTAASREPVGPVLARMVHALAAGSSVPAALRLFVTKWASAGESHSIAEFARELAYFARPDGQQLIQAVYERAMAAVQGTPVVEARKDASKESPRVLRPRPRPKANTRVPYVAAAAVVGLGIVATAVFAWRNAPASDRAPVESSSSAAADSSNGEGAPTAPSTNGSPARPTGSRASAAGRAGATVGAGAPAGAGARPNQGAGAQPTANGLSNARASSPVSSAVRASLGAPAAPSPRGLPPSAADPSRAVRAGAPRTPRRDESGPPVYSRSDPEVIPPAFLQPQLPGQLLSGIGPDMNTIELIVSEAGTVERVRLLSTPKRMPDMMLLSGAKNWVFEPASKDGQPVRYRLELSWAATP